jgi:small subunit ribosomal protein S18
MVARRYNDTRPNNGFGGSQRAPQRKKYCRFKKAGIRYIDYKDPDFLIKFVNEQGKILPRRITGTSLKFQRRISTAVKRARHLALLPFVTDSLK